MILRAAALIGAVCVVGALTVGCSHTSTTSAAKCGPGTPIFECPGVSVPTMPTVPNETDADSTGLVAARHSECNFGKQLLHYLATGDNGGKPWYDQNFASDVGVTGPRARAIADEAIQECDGAEDADTSSAVAATRAAAAESSAAQAQASRNQAADQQLQARTAACAAIGGKYWSGYELCESTVQGNPSGKSGSDCGYAHVYMSGDGVDQNDLAKVERSYPGCFTN